MKKNENKYYENLVKFHLTNGFCEGRKLVLWNCKRSTIAGCGQIHQSPATISWTDPTGVHHPGPPPPLQHPGRVRPLRHALQRRHRHGPVSISIRDCVPALHMTSLDAQYTSDLSCHSHSYPYPWGLIAKIQHVFNTVIFIYCVKYALNVIVRLYRMFIVFYSIFTRKTFWTGYNGHPVWLFWPSNLYLSKQSFCLSFLACLSKI